MSDAIGIILAAGGSTRMGQPKALLPVGGAPLIRRHVEQLLARCGRCVVVLGGHAEAISRVLPAGVMRVHNPDWQRTGPAESLALALHGLSGLAVVTPVDVPPVPLAVLDALLAVGGPAVPSWSGRDGHPVVVAPESAAVLGSGGVLRDVLEGAPRVAVDWPDTVLNLNTPGQWQRWIDGSAPAPR